MALPLPAEPLHQGFSFLKIGRDPPLDCPVRTSGSTDRQGVCPGYGASPCGGTAVRPGCAPYHAAHARGEIRIRGRYSQRIPHPIRMVEYLPRDDDIENAQLAQVSRIRYRRLLHNPFRMLRKISPLR